MELLRQEEGSNKVAHLSDRQVIFGLPTHPCHQNAPKWRLAWCGGGVAHRGGENSEGADLLLLCTWGAHWLVLQLLTGKQKTLALSNLIRP